MYSVCKRLCDIAPLVGLLVEGAVLALVDGSSSECS